MGGEMKGMQEMCASMDRTIMWIVYAIDNILTVWAVVKAYEIYDMRSTQGDMHYKDWLTELWSTTLTIGLLNILSGVLMAFYFGVMKREAGQKGVLITSKDATCKGVRIDNSPASMEALWKTIIILVGGLPYLLVFYVIGIARATRVITNSSMVDLIDKVDMLMWIVGGVIACKVIELYIGHTWAVLRTRCLKQKAMMQ